MDLDNISNVTRGCSGPNYKGVRGWVCTHHYQAGKDEPLVHMAGGGPTLIYAVWVDSNDIPINIRGPMAVPEEDWDKVRAVIDENFGIYPSEDEVQDAARAARALLEAMESEVEP